tara:strand:- start:33507 stop:33920 length:414 start_codon:yes stop_codon:yes gene_type:complete
MNFMESPVVERCIEEIEFLQDRVQEIAMIVDLANKESHSYETDELKIEFLHSLYALAEKEHNLYTRLSLSKDADAQDYKCYLEEQSKDFGIDKSGGLDQYYIELKSSVKDKIKELTDEDMDDYQGIDITFNWTDGGF